MARSRDDGSGCAISVTYAPGLYGFIFRIALRAIKLQSDRNGTRTSLYRV